MMAATSDETEPDPNPRGDRRSLKKRTLVLAGIALVAVVASAAVVFAARRDSDDETPATGRSFHIVYRLDEGSGDNALVSTDRVWVRRPFESRTENWTGAPPGEERFSYEVSAFGVLETSGNEGPLTLAVLPAVGAADVRLAPALEDAIDDGLLKADGDERHILGRRCDVFRSRVPLGAGPLRAPAANEYADSCVDDDGFVLEESYFLSGKRVSHRVAVELEEDAAVEDDLFETGPLSLPVDSGGGSVRRVEPDSRPPGDEFWELDDPPSGFRHRARVVVIPPQPENFSDPLREAHIRASVADVWVRGDDLLIIDQGGTLRGEAPFQADPTRRTIDLGEVGKGEVVLDARGNQVRVLLGNGRYLSVIGTLTPDELAAVGRDLHRVEGGELKFIDPPEKREGDSQEG